MISRKQHVVVSSAVWPYTPEASPRISPIQENTNMSQEDLISSARPTSLAIPRDNGGTLSPSGRPTLNDVLDNRAPPPYTLSAYTAFLSQQHCLETLAFTMDAKRYREKYDNAAAHMAGMPLNYESDEGFDLVQDWTRMLDIYIKPGAPQEINLPSEERDDLLDWPYGAKPPPPEALDPSVKRMHDLMSDSIFIPFCNSLKTPSHAQTYTALSDFGGREDRLDTSRSTFDDHSSMQSRPSRRKPSPSSMSNCFDLPSRSQTSSHRHTQSSNLSSALNRSSNNNNNNNNNNNSRLERATNNRLDRAASNRLSTHVSNSSAASQTADCALLSDDSGSADSPGPAEPRTPPTTPPISDLPHLQRETQPRRPPLEAQSPPKSGRSDSGSWKGLGKKLGWSKKKSAGTLRERADES